MAINRAQPSGELRERRHTCKQAFLTCAAVRGDKSELGGRTRGRVQAVRGTSVAQRAGSVRQASWSNKNLIKARHDQAPIRSAVNLAIFEQLV
jgi:hypothetical protein